MQFSPNVGLTPFSLIPWIPEPSAIGLAVLATAVLFGFRQQERRGRGHRGSGKLSSNV